MRERELYDPNLDTAVYQATLAVARAIGTQTPALSTNITPIIDAEAELTRLIGRSAAAGLVAALYRIIERPPIWKQRRRRLPFERHFTRIHPSRVVFTGVWTGERR
jgi:hypothetical protein